MKIIRIIVFFSLILLGISLSGCLQQETPPSLSDNSLNTKHDSIPPTTASLPAASLPPPTVSCSPSSCIPPPGGYRPQPPFEGATPLFSPDVDEVVSWLGPDLKIPMWLPEWYVFSEGGLWEPESDGRHVLAYDNGSGSIFIVYSYHTDWYYRTFLPGEPETACINGREVLFFPGNTSSQVRWCDGPVIRWITGPVSEQEILRIAESLSPPGAVNLTSRIYNQTRLLRESTPVSRGPGVNVTFPVTPSVS